MKVLPFLIVGFLLLVTKYASAQQIEITGKILDAKKEPIEYANVQLLNKDSVFVKGAVSNQNGEIRITMNGRQNFWLVISAIGYESVNYYLEERDRDLKLGDVIMKEKNVSLDNIIVSANRVIHTIDRQIVIPSSLQQRSANTALELLRNMSLPLLNVNTQEKKLNV